MKVSAYAGFVAMALVLASVSGCAAATAAPEASPSSSPKPTPTATEPERPGKIVIGADELSIRTADDTELDSFGYGDDSAVVAAALTEIFGTEPVTTNIPSDLSCQPEVTTLGWEHLSMSTGDSGGFSVSTRTPSGTVIVESAEQARIGGSFSELLGRVPEARTTRVEHEGGVFESLQESVRAADVDVTPEVLRRGVLVQASDDVIVAIAAPSILEFE